MLYGENTSMAQSNFTFIFFVGLPPTFVVLGNPLVVKEILDIVEVILVVRVKNLVLAHLVDLQFYLVTV
jgi:hypothetical protein